MWLFKYLRFIHKTPTTDNVIVISTDQKKKSLWWRKKTQQYKIDECIIYAKVHHNMVNMSHRKVVFYMFYA